MGDDNDDDDDDDNDDDDQRRRCDIFVTIPQDLARAMQPSDQLTDTLAMYEVILSDFGKYMS